MIDFQNITACLVGIVTVILALSCGKFIWKRSRLPPGPFPLPILGNFLQLRSDGLLPSLKKMSTQYGPVYTVHFGSYPVVVVTGYQALKEVFLEYGDAFLDRGYLPLAEQVFAMEAITLTNGDTWKQLRQFCLHTLKDFGMGRKSVEEPILEEAHHLVEYFKSLNEQPCETSTILSCASSNILASMLMNTRYDYSDKKWMQVLLDARTAFNMLSSPWGQLYDMFPATIRYFPAHHRKIVALLNPLRESISESVRSHQETLDPACARDFIDCFLIRMKQEEKNHKKPPFTINYLAPGVLDMFSGGTETTGITMYFGFLILIKHPELQDKLHEEVDRVIGRVREPRAEERNQMPYIHAFIHEIQRVSDVIPMGLMRSTTRDVTIQGHYLRKGTTVLPMLTTSLKDPTQFQTPEIFNIKHFLDETGKFKKNNASIPFSAGKRNCIAESLVRIQLFLFFTIILQNFTLKSTEDPEDLDISPEETSFTTIPPSKMITFIPRT